MKSLLEMGIAAPDILLPRNTDTATWATIACDQHTTDRSYWKKADEIVGEKPSTLRLMLPEVYLNDSGKEKRIKDIHSTMKEYLDSDLFKPHHGFVYVERKSFDANGKESTRRGIMAAIDLEQYDWHHDTTSLIRATEATIPERIPPRVAIREGAPLDMPHIMLLANDSGGVLVEAVGEYVHKSLDAKDAKCSPLYDGELMLGGGHITGYEVDSEGERIITAALNTLFDAGKQKDGSTFLLAVGDGNHSLATAKAVWDNVKDTIPEDKRQTSPIRYALVEIVNLYDEGLSFEPIHRVLFDVDAIDFLAALVAGLGGGIKEAHTEEEMLRRVHSEGNAFGIVVNGRFVVVTAATSNEATSVHGRGYALPVAQIQDILDDYLRGATPPDGSANKVRIDYVHGDAEAIALGSKDSVNNVAILLPPFCKDGLFQTIVEKGSLPRKSFSMGEAAQKRYYMECRRLFCND